jgi:peptide/nickel transport system permease protein
LFTSDIVSTDSRFGAGRWRITEKLDRVASLLLRLLIRRFALAVPLVFGVVTLTFFLIHLAPGDPALILAGDAPTPEFLSAVRAAYGLDQSVWRQFVAFFCKAVAGDFGTSIYYGRPVFLVILDRLPATILLTGTALVVASSLGIIVGVAAAKRAGSRADTMISAVSLIGYSVPSFWVGQLFVLLFALQLHWFPAGGMTTVRARYIGVDAMLDVGMHMVLPVATLAVFLMTLTARFTRAAMVEALDQDFVIVAEAKGVCRRRIVWHHAFRNALVTTVTVIGLEFGAVIAGALVIEVIYSWPGLGRLFYDAIFRRDFPLLTGCFILTSTMVVVVNALTDVACAVIDPRLR